MNRDREGAATNAARDDRDIRLEGSITRLAVPGTRLTVAPGGGILTEAKSV
jgi:hypothetical protein